LWRTKIDSLTTDFPYPVFKIPYGKCPCGTCGRDRYGHAGGPGIVDDLTGFLHDPLKILG
jgi:hypothetical protein